ncbi:hypothetical protein ACIA8O_20175 [Kitasatospora sp. NPDC051853]|uniref:hypothetical protein n=1 Tax=Kitasatospora sp. NPDC051853 TaxID=3364058 RepID=UPI0037ABA6FC
MPDDGLTGADAGLGDATAFGGLGLPDLPGDLAGGLDGHVTAYGRPAATPFTGGLAGGYLADGAGVEWSATFTPEHSYLGYEPEVDEIAVEIGEAAARGADEPGDAPVPRLPDELLNDRIDLGPQSPYSGEPSAGHEEPGDAGRP